MQPSNFIVELPGYGKVDLGQVPGPALVHVLQGGKIAGLPAGSLEFAVQEYLTGMYSAAARALQNNPLPQDRQFLPPLSMFAREVVLTFLDPSKIPYLTPQQIAVINHYYANQVAPFLTANQN
uniref:Uncharacterized protein n=1 Tax=Panagrolaimus davidi TaxID=227884 RepID=A0A914NXD0_9BILA